MKEENFTFFGGINQKASPSDLSILEFLDISNFDFTSTGALQTRQGTTTTAPQGASLTQSVIYSNYFYSGSLQYQSLTLLTGASVISGSVNSIYEFTNLQGSSYLIFSSPGYFAYSGSLPTGITIPAFTLSQLYYVTPQGSFNYILDPGQMVVGASSAPTNSFWNFTSFVNRLFMCNGDHIYKWDGVLNTTSTTTYAFAQNQSAEYATGITGPLTAGGLMIPFWNSLGATPIGNAFAFKYCLPPPATLLAASNTAIVSAFTSATYTYSMGFVNERGFFGPVTSPITVGVTNLSSTAVVFSNIGFSLLSPGGLTQIFSLGYTIPSGYGIGTSLISNYYGTTLTNFVQTIIYRDNGPGTGRYALQTFGPVVDTGLPTSNIPEPTCIFATLAPQFLEIYNNQMFMCGFSQVPSTVQFSDIGQPESIQPQNNFDVRTNDGDYLTGMKSAFSNLFLFKNNSFHVLSGTDPTNFAVYNVSDQYGCISHRAIATFENQLMFLDKKGICLYNGAAIHVASSKLDPIFQRMNISAAKNSAWMVHNKQRNQVWCGIPVNGSTLINQIIVYDYLLNAWTHFDGVNVASAAIGFGSLSNPTVYMGGYSGQIGYFGPSLTGDAWTNGNAIQYYAQTRFIADLGQSVEKVWRRLYMNMLSANGATNLWNVALYANYASLPSVTFIQGGMSFQSRSDFGLPAKALSVRISGASSSDLLMFQGFTIESRFQRNT